MASGEGRVKGSMHRVITTPGYHITPQWDLTHTRQIIHEKRAKKKTFQLMLAPMVDMFSILVIYLIMNFSSEGEVFFMAKELTIPKASTGQPMRNYPLISVVGGNIVFDALESKGTVSEVNNESAPQLRAALRNIKQIELSLGAKAFKGQINLQADEKAPVEDVKKVMRVLIDEGWTGINFVVNPAKK